MKHPLAAGAESAFSLVEVVLALGVTSFCLIALIGLLSAGLTNNRSTIDQAGATTVLSSVTADLYATPRTNPPGAATTSSQFQIPIPASTITAAPAATVLYFDSNGQPSSSTPPSTTLKSTSAYCLTITPIVPTGLPTAGTAARAATLLDLKVTWPAAAKTANASGSAETFVSLNRN
jgi:uncharacterized protein (TIGR02598 family)